MTKNFGLVAAIGTGSVQPTQKGADTLENSKPVLSLELLHNGLPTSFPWVGIRH